MGGLSGLAGGVGAFAVDAGVFTGVLGFLAFALGGVTIVSGPGATAADACAGGRADAGVSGCAAVGAGGAVTTGSAARGGIDGGAGVTGGGAGAGAGAIGDGVGALDGGDIGVVVRGPLPPREAAITTTTGPSSTPIAAAIGQRRPTRRGAVLAPAELERVDGAACDAAPGSIAARSGLAPTMLLVRRTEIAAWVSDCAYFASACASSATS